MPLQQTPHEGIAQPEIEARLQFEQSLETLPAPVDDRQVIHDCSICPEMVVIPQGNFRIGDGKFSHFVTFTRPVAIGRTEVTQRQWQAVMGYNPSDFNRCGEDCPVEQVSWNEVQDYLRKLSVRTGRQYRLPSEAEWEIACRAGAAQKYCGGDDADPVAWYDGNSMRVTHLVAKKQANAFGLYDMSGNVWEWTADSFHTDFANAPWDGSAWEGNADRRVLRGGAWSVSEEVVGASVRGWIGPALRFRDVGFRVARVIP